MFHENIANINDGMGPPKLADTLKISLEEAEELFKLYAQAFPKLNSWLDSQGKFGVTNYHSRTFSPCKRIRWYPEMKEIPNLRLEVANIEDSIIRKEYWKKILSTEGQVFRNSMNSPIQGTGADITKEALISVRDLITRYNKKYGEEVAYLICTVHDAIDVEVREDLAEQFAKEKKQLMIEAANKYVKTVSIGVDVTITKYWYK